MNGLVRFALGLANVPDALVGEIDAALPGAGRLIAIAKQLEPDLKALAPLVEQAAPIIERLTPVVNAAWPDFIAVLPTLEKVVDFVSKK